MTSEELRIVKGLRSDPKMIKVDDLKDKSDRTLLYGYTCERKTWHVYLKSGNIHVIEYRHDYTRYLPDELVEIEPKCNEDYIPDKRLYPTACDFEFCMMLKSQCCDLPFTSEDNRQKEIYYGYTVEDAELNCLDCKNGDNPENCNKCEEYKYFERKRK